MAARVLTSLLVIIVTAGLSSSLYAATPEEEFAQAENAFRFQDYKGAAEMLEGLMYPRMRLPDPDQQIKAHEYLAACNYWLGNKSRMEEEFTALLTQAPLHELDPFFYPGELINEFQKLKLRLIELHILDPEKARAEAEPACTMNVEVVEKRSKLPMLVPFGVGQFVNGKNTKGALFLTGELVFLGLNIGTWAGAESLRGDDGLYSRSDAEMARKLQIVQYVSLGAFVGLAVWGIVDAFLDFVPEKKSFKVMPCPTGQSRNGAPDGLGICFHWGR